MAKQKIGKKLPKRVGRSGHKARYERYKARATCVTCGVTFKSPKKKQIHIDNGHKPPKNGLLP